MQQSSLEEKIETFLTMQHRRCAPKKLFEALGLDISDIKARWDVYRALRSLDRRRRAEGKPILSVLLYTHSEESQWALQSFLVELKLMEPQEDLETVVGRLAAAAIKDDLAAEYGSLAEWCE